MPKPGLERVKAIFAEAVEKTAAERDAFLHQTCGDDAELLAEVQAFLSASERAGDFLESPTTNSFDSAGSIIGPYKLLELIGEGGFGSVFMAEQERPVRRKVALKIIKLGMDTRQVIARFEAERQALAMMDHPNIAKVFDAGATESGRPYFVMELVKGEPITEYADHNQLTIHQRLELFSQVCHAVQHAHQKGVIHRDIKPRNVLVSTQDGRSFAKVIDFGIAKAMSAQLTDKTLFTEFKQLVGTPQYMSPEQAGGSLDIDTRTDIYSLGVLLYELLTGTTPFSAEELRSSAYDEMRRIIREDEPPKPSTRLSQSTATLPSVAALRSSEPKKLGPMLRGDLDWIVMKTLEKDRGRRYATPDDIAADLGRYLGDEVVDATPPSAAYQLKKFYRRHRGAVITGTAIVATILAALVASSIMYRKERTARQQAEIAGRQAELARQSERVQKEQAETNFGLARDAVDRLTDIAQDRLMDASDLAGVRRDMLEDAAKFYETFAQDHSDDPAVIIETERAERRAATLHYDIGQPWEAEAHDLRALALVQGLYNAQPNRVECQTELYDCYLDLGRLYEYELNNDVSAEKMFRRAEDVIRPLLDSAPENHDAQFEMFWLCMERAVNDMDCDRDAEAPGELKQALRISQHFAALAPNDTGLAFNVAEVRHLMGYHAARTGAYIEAEADYRIAILTLGQIHIAHPEDEWNTYNFAKSQEYLAGMLTIIGRAKEAEQLLREALAEIEPIAQRRSQYVLMASHLAALNQYLGDSLFAQGRLAEAHDAYMKAQNIRRQICQDHNYAPARMGAMIYLLALCPDKSVRDPVTAASIARAALQLTPRNQYLWGDLGASLYQTGDWQGAIHAFEMWQEIGPRDLGCMRYVLALAQFKSGQPELARVSLAQAEHWAATTPPRYREPRFFATEARQVILGIAAPPAASTAPTTMSADPASQP